MALKLTKLDQAIYDHFRSEFPSLNVQHIDVDEMKSNESKEVTRLLKLITLAHV